MIDHRQVEIFHAIMKTGSITGAANLLFSSQPTISRELARLEQICGFKLFERKSARIYPTEAALVLYEEVIKSHIGLEKISHTVQQLKQHQIGHLNLCCLPFLATTLLPTVIAKFKQHVPQAHIAVTPIDTPFLEANLSSQQFHVGLIENPSPPLGTSIRLQLQSNEICILPDQHPLLGKAELTPEDFSDQSFISMATHDPYRQLIDQLFHQMQIHRVMEIETHSVHSICAMVKKGLGISIINPLAMLDYLDSGLQWRPISFTIPFTLSLVQPNYRPSSTIVDLFVDDLNDVLQDLHQWLTDNKVPSHFISNTAVPTKQSL
ncbi:LysR family transcriptional regulator [Acinetobacter baumannii]|uniref:LysR family transcriptional regulator n=1 Tax=Acinetobacter baumannii TaxID=470 RepID=UPI003FA5FF0C